MASFLPFPTPTERMRAQETPKVALPLTTSISTISKYLKTPKLAMVPVLLFFLLIPAPFSSFSKRFFVFQMVWNLMFPLMITLGIVAIDQENHRHTTKNRSLQPSWFVNAGSLRSKSAPKLPKTKPSSSNKVHQSHRIQCKERSILNNLNIFYIISTSVLSLQVFFQIFLKAPKGAAEGLCGSIHPGRLQLDLQLRFHFTGGEADQLLFEDIVLEG